jgi:hypothetical protein
MARSEVVTVTAQELETQTLAVYAVDMSANVYLPGSWGTLRYDGVDHVVSGGRALFLSQTVGSMHLLEFVSAPGYVFDHWVGLSGDSWVSPVISSPNSSSTNVTIVSGGPNGVVVYLKLAPKIATSISINVSPTSGNVPFDIGVTGKLIDSAGNPLVGKSIVLYMNGIYVDTRITTISPPGEYGFSVVISTPGTYQCQVEFAGDDTYEGCSVHNGTCGLEVGPPPPPISILLPVALGLIVSAALIWKGAKS